MKDDDWYKINDLIGFINHARELVFSSFDKVNETAEDDISIPLSKLAIKDKEELDRVLTFDECLLMAKNIIKIKINKKTKKETYFINELILREILESFNSRMVSNMLSILVADGILDSGFDSEKNDFIFWVKDENNKE